MTRDRFFPHDVVVGEFSAKGAFNTSLGQRPDLYTQLLRTGIARWSCVENLLK
jgi:hypothetical protein